MWITQQKCCMATEAQQTCDITTPLRGTQQSHKCDLMNRFPRPFQSTMSAAHRHDQQHDKCRLPPSPTHQALTQHNTAGVDAALTIHLTLPLITQCCWCFSLLTQSTSCYIIREVTVILCRCCRNHPAHAAHQPASGTPGSL